MRWDRRLLLPANDGSARGDEKKTCEISSFWPEINNNEMSGCLACCCRLGDFLRGDLSLLVEEVVQRGINQAEVCSCRPEKRDPKGSCYASLTLPVTSRGGDSSRW